MFSVSKALTTICVLQAVAEGFIDLDRPVADYWPEFTGQDKGSITTREILAHRAGLPAWHDPVARDLLYDWNGVADALARERPWWSPGTQHGYHARTFGFLLGEILRRTTGELPSRWLATRVAGPLEADVHLGLAEVDLSRCADMLPARIRANSSSDSSSARQALMDAIGDPTTLTHATFQNPSLGAGYMNSERFRKAEMPAMNGHGTAAGAARIIASIERLVPGSLLAEAVVTHSAGPDLVLLSNTRFGLGFMLFDPDTPIGVRPGTFGHAGAGGSVLHYDSERKLAFCYVMNQMEQGMITGGTSATRVAERVYACLD
jgi:CubicO group peptidase (beta-lactamase class C family)